MITVAILDDGICSSSSPTLRHVNCSLSVSEDGTITQVKETEKSTHGTLCAAIVRLYAPDAELISLRVLDPETGKGTVNQVRYALEWCIANNVSLINLSVGSASNNDWMSLRSTISKLTAKNIPLVCACSNGALPSIFTEFSWTISVEKDELLRENQYYAQNANFLKGDFYASGHFRVHKRFTT